MKPSNAIVLHLSTLIGSVHALQVSQTPSQKIHGIGASGAWWPHDLFQFPESEREQAAKLLFSADGLGLTSYRYNVGGGGVFVGNPVRAPETFFVSPGVYNWSADPQGVFFLKKAAAHKVPVLTAFVNSAPPAFTSNNRSCGGRIVDAQVPAYAQYLADVVTHWKQEGVHFTHVSPMNEPDSAFNSDDVTPCGQEGMIVAPTQRAAVVNAVRTALDAANLTSVGIMADESSSTGNFIPEAPTWIPSAAPALAAICHHQYGFGNDAAVAQMGAVGRNLSDGKDTWFTEICCWGSADPSRAADPAAPLTYKQGYEPSIVGGLQLAQVIYQSFTQALDAHFDFWTAISNGIGCTPTSDAGCTSVANAQGWNDGLIYYDPAFASNGNHALYIPKRFFVFKHFAQFIPPGATRHTVTDLPVGILGLAFKFGSSLARTSGASVPSDASKTRASLLLMNMSKNATTVNVNDARLGNPVKSIRTSQSEDWVTVPTRKPGSDLSLPGLSITTLSFR